MNKKQKEEQIKLFAEAFHEVVVPLLENMATKDDIANMATKDDIDRIERKLTKKDDRLDRFGKNIDDHEKRISKLEISATLN